MATSAARRRPSRVRSAGRRGTGSTVLRTLARIGLAVRGIMYVIIGWLAVRIAFGNSRQQADRTGALHEVAATPAGQLLLWVIVVGFAGLALWRLAEAAARSAAKPASRLASLGRAVIYGVIAFGTLKYVLGLGAPQSSNQQSVDLTAAALKYPAGRAIVVVAGLVLIGGGLYLAYQAWRREFRKDLQTTRMTARTRKAVEWLGVAGGIARGIVFVTAGIFLVIAAVRSQPQQAKGVDSALRALAATPLGPWLLVLVAIGLIMFGAYSCCQARWFRD